MPQQDILRKNLGCQNFQCTAVAGVYGRGSGDRYRLAGQCWYNACRWPAAPVGMSPNSRYVARDIFICAPGTVLADHRTSMIDSAFPFNTKAPVEALVRAAEAPAVLRPALVLACETFLPRLQDGNHADAFFSTVQGVWPAADDFAIENLYQGLVLLAGKQGSLAD